VHLFYLNGRNSGLDHGLDRIPRQARGDGTAPIALLGKADSETRSACWGGAAPPPEEARSPAMGGEAARTPFDGTGLGASSVVDTDSPAVGLGSAVSFDEPVMGLSEGTFYHWRSRIVSSDPFFPRSPWMSLTGNNVTETKFRTAGCVDGDGDGFGALDDPSCPSLVLDCDDQSASAWVRPGDLEPALHIRHDLGLGSAGGSRSASP